MALIASVEPLSDRQSRRCPTVSAATPTLRHWSTHSPIASVRSGCFASRRWRAISQSALSNACRRCTRQRCDLARHCRVRLGCSHPPEPVETTVAAAGSPAALFIWRNMRHRVAQADGPERILGEWWRADTRCTACARLLPRRDGGRRALLAVPRRAGRSRRALVAAWRGRAHELRRAPGHDAFFVPARRLVSPKNCSPPPRCSAFKALGIVDRNSLAGMVRAHEAAKVDRRAPDRRLPPRSRRCGTSLLVYPTDRAAYGRLCRLLTVGKAPRRQRRSAISTGPMSRNGTKGLLAILVPDDPDDELARRATRGCTVIFGDRAYCALTRRFRPNETPAAGAIANARAGGPRADRRHQRRALSLRRSGACCRTS